ncbi:MAG: nucleotidyltransferase family protein [Ekhidna sp.]
MSEQVNIGLVVLAAGTSIRLGRPKQLVTFEGKTLLQRTMDCGGEDKFQSKVLVVGANADEILSETNCGSFDVCINERWKEGMAGSLKLGLEKSLELNPNLKALMILVSDQPFVRTDLLNEMIKLHTSESCIVICQYEGVNGVPALLGNEYFNEILALEGDQGAKKIIKNHLDHVKTITFDQGSFDIDTPEDLKRLNALENGHASND